MSKNKHERADKASQRAAENLKDALHRVDDGLDAVFDDIEEADSEDTFDEKVAAKCNAEAEGVSDVDDLAKRLEEKEKELEKEKKEYLFLMADFDNFRKRVMKEKADLIRNAAEKVLKGVLPIVDDFERGLEATRNSDNAEGLREGMELIYNKLVKFLSENGVKAMETSDADFDAELHDAIASVPTGDETKKGKIIDTTQKGYTLNDKVLRHAKVVVGE